MPCAASSPNICAENEPLAGTPPLCASAATRAPSRFHDKGLTQTRSVMPGGSVPPWPIVAQCTRQPVSS
ncbi:MAG: hypothetical protein ACK6DM_15395, partial [Alphaproteobacteria bacterium]